MTACSRLQTFDSFSPRRTGAFGRRCHGPGPSGEILLAGLQQHLVLPPQHGKQLSGLLVVEPFGDVLACPAGRQRPGCGRVLVHGGPQQPALIGWPLTTHHLRHGRHPRLKRKHARPHGAADHHPHQLPGTPRAPGRSRVDGAWVQRGSEAKSIFSAHLFRFSIDPFRSGRYGGSGCTGTAK
ncbi:hypothetical protein [Streptomyces sp. NPDC058424]|uniref:hypothetical protein n=1 Tax=Streptomyces sp. NPDC058424 TaxID=3346491 RepID=UPI00364BD0AC